MCNRHIAQQRRSHPPPIYAVQIGTSDGRIKLVGAAGAETTLCSPYRSATTALHQLPNRGSFLRLCSDGALELWSIPQEQLSARVFAPSPDTFVSCHPLQHDPYVLLGCASGAMRVAAVLGTEGEPLEPLSPAGGLRVLPYAVSADGFGVPEDTALISVQPQENAHAGLCALTLHEWQRITVYNLRRRAVRPCVLRVSALNAIEHS